MSCEATFCTVWARIIEKLLRHDHALQKRYRRARFHRVSTNLLLAPHLKNIKLYWQLKLILPGYKLCEKKSQHSFCGSGEGFGILQSFTPNELAIKYTLIYAMCNAYYLKARTL